MIQNWRQSGGTCGVFYKKENGSPVGRISIRKTDTEHVWDTGYWVHPDFQGQGYATEMLKAIVKFAFNTLKATRITSAHASWNEASGKVLKKAGFTHIGHNPCGFTKHGVSVPEEEYEILL